MQLRPSVKDLSARTPSSGPPGPLQTEIWALVRVRFLQLQSSEGLTQAALATRLGVTPAQVSLWLADPRRITVKAADRLLSAMNATVRCELEVARPDTKEAR